MVAPRSRHVLHRAFFLHYPLRDDSPCHPCEHHCFKAPFRTTYQVADVFTKALDKTTFLKFRAALLNLSYDNMPEKLRAILY